MSKWHIRNVEPKDVAPLAGIWHEQWSHAHAQYVPAELTALRTFEDFQRRLIGYGDRIRTVGPVGAPLGFCAIKHAEIDQIYVDQSTYGSGLAGELLSNGEARIAAAGHETASLVCVKQNLRAQAFYKRHGWVFRRTATAMLATSAGEFPLETLLFEKTLATHPTQTSIAG